MNYISTLILDTFTLVPNHDYCVQLVREWLHQRALCFGQLLAQIIATSCNFIIF